MPSTVSIDSILGNSTLIEKLYDMARVVDPVHKVVYDCSEKTVDQISCHQLWGRELSCENCISARAYNENTPFVKLDYNGETVYMVTAVPIETGEGRVVLEMLRDVTSTGLFDDGESTMEIAELVSRRNDRMIKDPLVNCYNKRYILERLPYEIVDAAIKHKRLSLIMADIDWFRTVNNDYGHLAGDEVLKGFGEVLTSSLSGERNWVARYGGEEFLVFLHDTDEAAAHLRAEKMRATLAETTFEYDGKPIKVTASFGVVSLDQPSFTMEEVIKAADDNLYAAKRGGRNRVVTSAL